MTSLARPAEFVQSTTVQQAIDRTVFVNMAGSGTVSHTDLVTYLRDLAEEISARPGQLSYFASRAIGDLYRAAKSLDAHTPEEYRDRSEAMASHYRNLDRQAQHEAQQQAHDAGYDAARCRFEIAPATDY